MDGTVLVRRLIDGPQTITRMRREIDRVVNLIIESLRHTKLPDGLNRKSLESFDLPGDAAGYWQFKSNILGLAFVNFISRQSGWCLYSSQFDPGGMDIPTPDDVLQVHAALPMLASEMLRIFPPLEDTLKPILTAADAK